MPSFFDLQRYAKTGIASADMTAFDKMRALAAFGGSTVQTLTGIPPLTFKADGSPITIWSMKGNGSQQGTPTPDNPIMPEFVGVRTGNLANLYGVDKTFLGLHCTVSEDMSVVINGTKVDGANVRSLVNPNITLPAGTYTVKVKMVGGSITNVTDGLFFGINSSTYELRTAPAVKQVGDTGKRTFTLSEDKLLSSIDVTPGYGSNGSVWDNATFQCWFYSGSDNKDYEPYGWKVPITCAGQTVPVYLGQTQTVWRVGKCVLTGEEDYNRYDSNRHVFRVTFASTGISRLPSTSGICSHFEQIGSQSDLTNGQFAFSSSYVYFRMDSITPKSDFIEYIRDQYAAGTPVTIWYVLATPTTGIINEPLAKIGDYADELSSTDAGVAIPTAKGQNTLTVDTDLQPSEMTITYRG